MLFGRKDPKDDPANRRQHPRVPSRNLVRVLRETGEEIERLSNVYDLSVGGVRLVCHEALPTNTMVKVVLNVPEKNQVLELSGRVAWTCPMKGQKGAYFAGLEFMKMSDRDRAILEEIVADRTRPPA